MTKLLLTIIAAIFLSLPSAAWAELAMNDSLAIAGKTLRLRAETRGKVLAKGGVMVEFMVDGNYIGSVLSGGDGIAYKEHLFSAPGTHSVAARVRNEEASAEVLVLASDDVMVLVEVEGSLVKQEMMKRLPRPEAAETLNQLARKYRIAYLAAGLPAKHATKKWLKDNGFPDAPVLDMGEGIFKGLAKNSIKVKAVIGSDDLASRARKCRADLFVFGKGKLPKGAHRVKSWGQIRKALLEN